MLKIENLQASINDKSILKGLNLEVKAGEVHAIMGPNGAGKSTLANAIGKPSVSFTFPLTLVWACRTMPVSHKRNRIYFFIVGLNGFINTKQ